MDSYVPVVISPGIIVIVYFLAIVGFIIWAVCLALKVPKNDTNRPLHIFLAIIASPFYIISYYVNKL